MQEKSRKTQLQIDIETSVTSGRSYLRVPYTKLFGKKRSLRQWLRFAEYRMLSLYNTTAEKLPLSVFLPRYLKEEIPRVVIGMVIEQDRINSICNKLEKNLKLAVKF